MYTFFGGVEDPEMRAIKVLVEENGFPFKHATYHGVPVTPSQAYQADFFDVPEGHTAVLVECESRIWKKPCAFIQIDHHRPGDPGYDTPAKHFWKGSSLGQVCEMLTSRGYDVRINHAMKVLAAMDHCSGAASRGECPGIEPNEVLGLRLQYIASGFSQSLESVRIQVALFEDRIRLTPSVEIGKFKVRDLRDIDLGDGYSRELLVAQLAALSAKESDLLRHRDGLKCKITLSGHVSEALVDEFLSWGEQHGLKDVYGVPVRGYAGGYIY